MDDRLLFRHLLDLLGRKFFCIALLVKKSEIGTGSGKR
jgi:hypothetical protein